MPKIIENLRENLIEEARKQARENGYAKVTMRSIAKGCGVGLGTTYNYFKSKDMLIATFMLEDWEKCLHNIRSYCERTEEPELLLQYIYEKLCEYVSTNQVLFDDEEAKKVFSASFVTYHKVLRSQIAELLKENCEKCAKEPTDFLPEFIAESMLMWTTSGVSFEDIYGALKHIYK